MKIEANLPELSTLEKLKLLQEIIDEMSPDEIRDMYNEIFFNASNEDLEIAKSYGKLEKVLLNERD